MDIEHILNDIELSESNLQLNLKLALKKLVQNCTNIPHPAQGQTLLRWQILSRVAATNLNLAKWFESHLDSLSILHELGCEHLIEKNKIYGIWAAEGSKNPLYEVNGAFSGQKAWCSGAGLVDQALVTYKKKNGNSQLIVINMHQSGIQLDYSGWKAVGMQHTLTATIDFDQVNAVFIGEPQQYLSRPGFWHGAAGVAACWYGATVRIAEFLQRHCTAHSHDYQKLYLGEVSTQLLVTKQYFTYVAQQIDQFPLDRHELIIRILRAKVEKTAQLVLNNVGQALGARPYCESRIFAEFIADLTVFLRQSHAAFDLKRIAELTLSEDDSETHKEQSWML